MKRQAIILAIFVSLFSMSLSARELVELPTKSISLILEGNNLSSRPMISLVQLVQPIDSTENQGNVAAEIVFGVVEVMGGIVMVGAGAAALGAGMVIHLARPEDRRDWLIAYSLGATGTALGLVVLDNGIKRIGFRGLGLFTSKQIAQPGIYYSE